MLADDFRDFIALLNTYEVEYLVAGGYAVTYHGYPRYTGDLDIWINPTAANAERVAKAVVDFGFDLDVSIFTRPEQVVQFGFPPLRIDLLTTIDGVTFEECYPLRVVEEYDGLRVDFIDLQGLIRNKRATGRLRDLDDIEHLTGE